MRAPGALLALGAILLLAACGQTAAPSLAPGSAKAASAAAPTKLVEALPTKDIGYLPSFVAQ
ncbi:MAG TPA: hypothetical protein VF157_01720, partial [Chloroflexota bacterium]